MDSLICSIPISKVKDMKSDVLWVLKASLLKITLNHFFELNFNNFQKKKYSIEFRLLSITFSPLELAFSKFISNSLAI
jgi:hypothetical protein